PVFTASFGGPLANVTMTFTAVAGGGAVPSPVTTDANGQWAQTGFAPGTTYRVTPSLPEYVFSPASLDFSAFAPGLGFSGYFIGCGGFAVTPITVGQTLSGILDRSDSRWPTFWTSYFVDRYSFSGVAGQQMV